MSSLSQNPVVLAPPGSQSLPTPFLGTINPRAARRFHWASGTNLSTAATDTWKIFTFDVATHSKFKTQTKGWSVVRIESLAVHIQPHHNAKDKYIEILYTWIPEGEDAPTTYSDAEDFQLTKREHLYPAVAGAVAPPLTISAPIGTADLSGNIKPKPVAGGRPQLVVLINAYKKDGSHDPTADLAVVSYEFRLALGV